MRPSQDSSQTLTCTVTLPEAVDTDVIVGVVWRFNNTLVAPSARVEISPVSSTRSPFTSTLTLSPLRMPDAGQFSCEAIAYTVCQYITASSLGKSQDRTVTVDGMLLNVIASSVVLTIISSSFSFTCTRCEYIILWSLYTAGLSYSLQCSASVVADLVMQPDLDIVFPNTTDIVAMNSTSLTYTFSPLRASDGGQYTCIATVNIPEIGIANLQNSATKNVIVACLYDYHNLLFVFIFKKY